MTRRHVTLLLLLLPMAFPALAAAPTIESVPNGRDVTLTAHPEEGRTLLKSLLA